MHDIIFLAQKIEQEHGTRHCMRAFDGIDVLIRNDSGEVCGSLDFSGFQEYVIKNDENSFLSDYVGLSDAEMFEREDLHEGILNYIYQQLKTFEQPLIFWDTNNRPTYYTTNVSTPRFVTNSMRARLSFSSDDVELQEDGTMVVRGVDPQSLSIVDERAHIPTEVIEEQVAQRVRDALRDEPMKIGLMIIYNKKGSPMKEKWFGLRTDALEKFIAFIIDLRWKDEPYIIHKVCIGDRVICHKEDLDKIFEMMGINV